MTIRVGRSGLAWPREWIALTAQSLDSEACAAEVLRHVHAGRPIEVSRSVALWGHALGDNDAKIMVSLGRGMANARDRDQARDLVLADIVQALACLRRDSIGLMCLEAWAAVEEFQLDGAIQALVEARDEGVAVALGLDARGGAGVALALWQFRDAFDVVIVPQGDLDGLDVMARERRVSVAVRGGGGQGDFVIVDGRRP